MWVLARKEIQGFFGNITGYLVITVFLVLNSLFLWIFDSGMNILESGYAGIDGLFIISPWLFLFLIPAVTMRLFSEEFRLGTIAILKTRPLTDTQIITGKFIAGLTLVIIALLPTLLYYFSVYILGETRGNIDVGGTFGSYIGLLFLAAGYVSMGLFASSLSDNPIIAFLIGMLICFVFYYGFDQLASVFSSSNTQLLIMSLGINEHYISMSRGVIDSRDALYFISLIVLFVFLTKLVLKKRV
ncbi:MAG: gliding motility-associated ABC transporter permease subunit GldF [Cryomorphaceae bacterium]|nr:gliding motility-associated ABC transporter permease subunit GldF [Cryomorphaceae bacterium]